MSHTTLPGHLRAGERLPGHVLAPQRWLRCLHQAQPCTSSLLPASSPLIPVFGKANTWWITQKYHTEDNTWQLHYRKRKKTTLEASAGAFIECTSCCSGLWQLQL